jgi:hypothetical protein
MKFEDLTPAQMMEMAVARIQGKSEYGGKP